MRMAVILLAALSMVTAAQAALKTETVHYKFGEMTFAGYLVYDDAQRGQRPGVLVIHEWWGLNDYPKRRADSLAALGYVAFAPDLYGNGKVAATTDEAKALTGPLYADRALLRNRMNAALERSPSGPKWTPAGLRPSATVLAECACWNWRAAGPILRAWFRFMAV